MELKKGLRLMLGLKFERKGSKRKQITNGTIWNIWWDKRDFTLMTRFRRSLLSFSALDDFSTSPPL